MLKDLIKKENEFASQIIASYEDEIKKTEQDISYIDDKYKKLAEEEKKSLNAELAELKNRLSQWKASIIADLSEGDKTKTEEEPKIEDTLFPENNEPETQEIEPEGLESSQVESWDGIPEDKDWVTQETKEEIPDAEKTDDDDWGEPKDWN